MSQFSPQATQEAPSHGMTLDLLELFYRLLDRRKLIIASTLIGAVIMAVFSLFIARPTYCATSRLYVLTSRESAINLSDLQIGSYLTSDYQEVFTLWEVHEMVLRNLGLDYTYEELDQMVKVTNPSNTRMLDITVSSENPREAASMANEYATVGQKYISDIMQTDAPSLMSQALVPEKPVSPRKTLNVLLGAFAGAFLMILIQTISYILDDKIKTSNDILRYLDLPTLAVIPSNGQAPIPERESGRSRRSRRKEDEDDA